VRRGMDEIVAFLGLDVPLPGSPGREISRVNASRPRGNPPHREWPPELRSRVVAQCGDLLDLYGYEF
jgi:hypothetical protein